MALVLFIIIVIGVFALIVLPGAKTAEAPGGTVATTTTPGFASLPDTITVTAPAIDATVTSPITITGQARGGWYFEASAPVKLLNSAGSVIAQGFVTAQGDWMTSDFVPFSGSLSFPAQPSGSVGTLVLNNDNPSGEAANLKTLNIPVQF